MPSLLIAGTGYNVARWPAPTLERAIKWEELSSLNWSGSDRGAAQDIYESAVVFRGTSTVMLNLKATLNSNREGVTLSGFETPIFAPNVNHTGSISATVIKPGRRQHQAFANPITGFWEMAVGFHALAPPVLTSSPSLASLRPLKGYEADHGIEVGKVFTYDQQAFYSDRGTDIGCYIGTFMQTTAEAQAILAYICTIARDGIVAMPTIPGEPYPFGYARGTGPFLCRIKSVGIARNSLRYWDLRIEFREEAA